MDLHLHSSQDLVLASRLAGLEVRTRGGPARRLSLQGRRIGLRGDSVEVESPGGVTLATREKAEEGPLGPARTSPIMRDIHMLSGRFLSFFLSCFLSFYSLGAHCKHPTNPSLVFTLTVRVASVDSNIVSQDLALQSTTPLFVAVLPPA